MKACIIQIKDKHTFAIDKNGFIHKIKTNTSFEIGKEIKIEKGENL